MSRRVRYQVCFAALLVATFGGMAKAQGCGQISIDEGDITCCNGTEKQENRSCGGTGGNPVILLQ